MNPHAPIVALPSPTLRNRVLPPLDRREFEAGLEMVLALDAELDALDPIPNTPEFDKAYNARLIFILLAVSVYSRTPTQARISPLDVLGELNRSDPQARGHEVVVRRMEATINRLEFNLIDALLDRLEAGMRARQATAGISAAPRSMASEEVMRDIKQRIDRLDARVRAREALRNR